MKKDTKIIAIGLCSVAVATVAIMLLSLSNVILSAPLNLPPTPPQNLTAEITKYMSPAEKKMYLIEQKANGDPCMLPIELRLLTVLCLPSDNSLVKKYTPHSLNQSFIIQGQ